MSYCVNCGVKLHDSASKCALCDTEVLNPKKVIDNEIITPYPKRAAIPDFNRAFISQLLTIIMLIPAVVCTLIWVLTGAKTLWFLYVVSSLALLWVLIIVPILKPNLPPLLLIILDSFAVAVYVSSYTFTTQTTAWYMTIALPLIVLISILVFFFVWWTKSKKHSWPIVAIFILSELCILSVGIEATIAIYNNHQIVRWSLIPLACFLGLIIFFTLIATNKQLKQTIERRFHS